MKSARNVNLILSSLPREQSVMIAMPKEDNDNTGCVIFVHMLWLMFLSHTIVGIMSALKIKASDIYPWWPF